MLSDVSRAVRTRVVSHSYGSAAIADRVIHNDVVAVAKSKPNQDRFHVTFLSKVLGDQLEIVDLRPVAPCQRLCDGIKAVVDVIMDKRLLGLNDRLFDGKKLLCNVEARAILLQHIDH